MNIYSNLTSVCGEPPRPISPQTGPGVVKLPPVLVSSQHMIMGGAGTDAHVAALQDPLRAAAAQGDALPATHGPRHAH
eukprot:CAMPEP_0113701922 /NCGR_PEP_ID=MMETSP0038_2-20120614/24865_1 /TAXON_ID=2898 /ORGANISM="Cryptomonas paramecium" /LENGTH=77 /DNA_ID=CAMNT_0000625911 /DNA_START=37 /DNA_END=268 /DNA_ORIENTATION=+ /assembly_acc=CAM_ASM_000170